jgi:hypothetical protein
VRPSGHPRRPQNSGLQGIGPGCGAQIGAFRPAGQSPTRLVGVAVAGPASWPRAPPARESVARDSSEGVPVSCVRTWNLLGVVQTFRSRRSELYTYHVRRTRSVPKTTAVVVVAEVLDKNTAWCPQSPRKNQYCDTKRTLRPRNSCSGTSWLVTGKQDLGRPDRTSPADWRRRVQFVGPILACTWPSENPTRAGKERGQDLWELAGSCDNHGAVMAAKLRTTQTRSGTGCQETWERFLGPFPGSAVMAMTAVAGCKRRRWRFALQHSVLPTTGQSPSLHRPESSAVVLR